MIPLLKINNLVKKFPVRSGLFGRAKNFVHAVSDVSLTIAPGETVGLVGESGCGKTTLARMVVRLIRPDSGQIEFEGNNLATLSERQFRPYRRKIQMVFQDPFSSLNPRMTVGEIVSEPLMIHRQVAHRQKRNKVTELLQLVGLAPEHYDRYPHEFSGGQRQRIGIARAIALLPKLIVADEPVSALDVSVAAQIVNLLQDLQKKFNLSYLFIAHDLKMVKYLSHRIAVMYLGKVVEFAPKEGFAKPLHPYTQALMAAIPVADPTTKREKIVLQGEVPSPMHPPTGCSFHTRCPFAEARCRAEEPSLKEWKTGHWASCHFIEKING